MEINRFPLKECPFCGKEAELLFDEADHREYTYVVCSGCGIKTQRFYACVEECAMQQAADIWNKRYTESEEKS